MVKGHSFPELRAQFATLDQFSNYESGGQSSNLFGRANIFKHLATEQKR
jgi:hypothetical protein